MGIGNNIRELRQLHGLTQEELARRIGVTPSAVGNYEHEISFPKEDVLMRLFGALECTPNELFGLEELLSVEEYAHLNKYKALDDHGRELVDACTEIEIGRIIAEDDFVEVRIAARKGRASNCAKLKLRRGKSILDMPDYKGGGR
ncbi:MAG: helix-turn-helix domain-containing protein [Oscillospiraceae bacterium]|nr:helix-turn-helix domain-containing protein [Oscillospiraceae bacterium]